MPNRFYKGPVTDHFDGVRFFVPGHPFENSLKKLAKWQTGGDRRARWPKSYPSPFNDAPVKRVSGLRSTLIGHASYLLQIAGLNLLIDPVFAERASPVPFAGPKRVNAPGIAFDDLPPIHAVLITHNHYDHLDKRSIWRLYQRFQPQFIVPLGVDENIGRGVQKPAKMATLDWGQSHSLGAVTVYAIPTYHWSARGLRDRRMTLWCSYVITSSAGNVYHIGDTGYGSGEFSKSVASDFRRIDLAHIPIGAYEPRWFMQPHHVNPAEAVQIFQDCGARQAIGHHWGTFQLTNEAIDAPKRDLAKALADADIAADRFVAFRPGQVFQT